MKNIKNILKIFSICLMCFCLFKLVNKEISYFKEYKNNKSIQQIFQNNNCYFDKEKALLKINNDYKLWIKIPNTKVSYPVVQTNNNQYYLDHNFKKNKAIEGSLFIYDKYNEKNSQNLIIFGHNMRNKSMFGTLELFKDEKFFSLNKKIYIIKNNKKYTYKIFGVALVNSKIPYLKVDFDNNEFKKYINLLKKYSLNWDNIDINNKDKILTLSTCSYEYNEARLVIVSKLENVEVIN